MTSVRACEWDGRALLLLDQRQLPNRVAWVRCEALSDVAEAIVGLVVRGAPAIGVAAAYGMVLAARSDPTSRGLENAAERLRRSRPTAVNLGWAVDGALAACMNAAESDRADVALGVAERIASDDRRACDEMARHGAALIEVDGSCEVLTHCNTGALATAGVGTALGVVREIARQGRLERVWACEARPVLQGARLTAWEGVRDGLPMTLIADSAAATVLGRGRISAVFVGADRIAGDGGTANKIGTYPLAVLADRHDVPFYVVAPTSTIDLGTARGAQIPIEERDPQEVRSLCGVAVAPPEVRVFNPAFDVTPPELITAIVTEQGVATPPYPDTLPRVVGGEP